MKTDQMKRTRRLSLVLPTALFNDIDHLAKQEQKTYTLIVRKALEYWLEHRKAKQMEEGYLAMRDSNRKMMDEFAHVDSEIW